MRRAAAATAEDRTPSSHVMRRRLATLELICARRWRCGCRWCCFTNMGIARIRPRSPNLKKVSRPQTKTGPGPNARSTVGRSGWMA